MRINRFGRLCRLKQLGLVGICLAILGGPSPARAQVPDLGIDASLHGALPFPADNPWNQDISQLPVDPNSANLIASIGLNTGLHPDFGSAWWAGSPNGIPYIVVPGSQSLIPAGFTYADQSDPGPYPIPANAPIEGGASSNGDRHVLIVDRDNWILYEMYNAWPNSIFTSWTADAGAIFNLSSDALRPLFWTSADAAGLPIFPGLVRADEVLDQGAILHALRFTANVTRHAFTSPARHFASSNASANVPPMGMRVRLKAGFDITPYPAQVQVILTALKKYGMFLADNGSDWYISGTPDPRWDDTALHSLGQVLGSNFEVVQMGDVITDLVDVPANPQAAAGNASVTLSWTAAAGATGYNVKRATVSGGPYTTIGANVASTTYTDNGLANGTTYYYVVSGVCQTGQSTNSVEASATPSGAALTLASLVLNPSTVTAGASSQATVTLSSVAPSGGAAVSLSSGNTSAATVPANVTVPAGQTSVSFSVTTLSVTTSTQVSLLATYGTTTKTATLTVQSPALALSSLVLNPTTVIGGVSSQGTITLSGAAPSGGTVVSLTSNNAAATVPSSVTVPAGQTSAAFAITTGAVTVSTSVTLSATYGTTTKTAPLTVQPPAAVTLSSVTVNPSSVIGGVSSQGTVTLSGAAPSGGTVVSLTSNNAAATVPASVTVPAGQTSATFNVTTSAVNANTSVTLTATYAGVSKTATLTVQPSTSTTSLSSLTLSLTAQTGGMTVTGTVTLSAAPSSSVTVNLTSSNSAVASVPATVTIPAGKSSATFTINTSTVTAYTNVTISASYAGVTKTVTLQVRTPYLYNLTVSPSTVKGGSSSTGTAILSGPAPSGGIVVTLSSSNTAVASVPASVTVPAGQTSATFTVTTGKVASNTSVTISAILSATTRTATLTVTP